ncbi:glycosyltransferase family 4 protein [Synechococcus sp. CS-1329]|uniref:glycosyltransferase family 4 protein n=1 Tax=Synechococcus sp. CS-1329 TaxID=2847975 RepID=UPI00223AE715|nr:glycosyltransferase family 4 protein [Synechococcus sp. CS-1329]MCT0219804.1 glycosyltransferase family 4 protein [Synechococcus sp. CS-1329]
MRILLIADPQIPVPPTHYGGAERIVHLYCQEFARLGHQVHLMAAQGSQAYGGRLHIHRAPSLRYVSRSRRKIQFQLQSLWAARNVDVVFNLGRFDYLEALLRVHKPLLHNFPNPIDQGQIDFAEARVGGPFAFHLISENQRRHAVIHRPVHVIPNPVDAEAFLPGDGAEGYLAFLGRLTRNKGVDTAIEVARRSGRRLVIAGNVSNEQGGPEFFREQVQPHLDGDRIRWIGPVNDQQKQELLSGAAALLFPIRWEEPFGNVMVEALACGAPVIATRRASTPEVIEHGRTGFLCDSSERTIDEFVDAVAQVPQLNREHCREAVMQRFDVRVIAPRVLHVLHELSQGGTGP